MPDLDPALWTAVIALTLLAGFVKGTVGFAMPMIMISGLGSLLEPELALAALILPTLMTNALQALRTGRQAAWQSARRHKRYILIVLILVASSAQLVRVLPDGVMFMILGIPITVLATVMLIGWRPRIPPRRRFAAEVSIGGFAGFVGGLSGVWGPPTVIYLTALDTPKDEQLRVQGIVYGCAAVVLTAAHVQSGVLNFETTPVSALLCVPAFLGIALGFRAADRLDQERFRKMTLVVLIVAGANLVRRGIMA